MGRLSLNADIHIDPTGASGTIRRYLSFNVVGLEPGMRAVIRSRPPAHSRWIVLFGESGRPLAPIGNLHKNESDALAYLETWLNDR